MEFLKRLGVVEQACQQLLEPHPCQYNFAAETSNCPPTQSPISSGSRISPSTTRK